MGYENHWKEQFGFSGVSSAVDSAALGDFSPVSYRSVGGTGNARAVWAAKPGGPAGAGHCRAGLALRDLLLSAAVAVDRHFPAVEARKLLCHGKCRTPPSLRLVFVGNWILLFGHLRGLVFWGRDAGGVHLFPFPAGSGSFSAAGRWNTNWKTI